MGTTNAQTNSNHTRNEVQLSGSSIDAFFAGTVILVTGGTGFLGKALLEKLLRSCRRVATIYLLIRSKRGQSIEERCKELLKNPIFDRIRLSYPGALDKIIPVKGDMGMPELGLQPDDKDMLIQRVNIVFHVAATVRFDEPLKVAVNLNIKGTDRILDLCKCMKNLISIIHVSTAYSNADRQEINETVYSTQIKPHTVIEMCDNLDDEMINVIEKKLIGKHPNTYTLTKGLAEQIVLSKGNDLPIVIVRPSIVCAAYQEPFPGWIDNTCGITGIMAEMSRGIVRTVVCNEDLVVDVVPVDYVIDTLICASWYNATQRTNTIKIYNCTSSTMNPISWREYGSLLKKYAIQNPSKYVMWYPGFTFRTNKFLHSIFATTLHVLPAFVLDLIIRIQGGKPIMMKIVKRLERAAQTGEFFAMNEWKFYSGNMTELLKFVTASKDCSDFNLDFRNLDWDAYLHQYMLGIRKYIFRDDLNTLNKARMRLLKLYWIQKLIQTFNVFMLLWMIRSAFR
ncbi:putative fatty acyl-CoA reductase CG5065 isoform X1 [Harpegnathos saltator]|uniref:Fatty acyl-CoA reductase n=2 Tax=Harpegnathos saltator TaxID=610380 RepID=E2BCH8_HARSA|nr:putative fatty acyl-CoA reductase CG5065 isoform X1 [Harpegnathos saltator]XP_019696097.1 putative fatty acyl-CoA reductase CG5065 isoform X1 [Harpegnathos saltator]XP_025160634.1 putative fatty acyl-CoA reductase CG5065 isoform X1 [Harpegnathos saltator]XP_025160635.1 putative fatty acyl-CoA reductase CG5065 isoform X1 [Harpegnathos saltator]XP_025160636.1 putative fatty acyl-CoA reductase CG5065 isoform X1 [Harpegnathos saltator]EFN86604.1 Fatty acyl-CoA reductase 1 [Harpegnathos saltator